MRPLVRLNALLLLAILAVSAGLWPSLPDPVPVHFGLDGTPDRWGDRSAWWWMPGLAVVLTVLLGGLARWSAARPHLVNLPGKARLLALPPARQRPVLDRVADLLWFTNALSLALLGLIHWGIYQTALEGPSRGLSIGVVLLSVAMGPLVLLGLPYVEAELQRQEKAHAAETMRDVRSARGV